MFMKSLSSDRYIWTFHVRQKMRYYGLSEARIKRVIRHPERSEEGIADSTLAVMQQAGGKKDEEIWVMYVLDQSAGARAGRAGKVKVITAWRYPGASPKRNPIPADILREVSGILFS